MLKFLSAAPRFFGPFAASTRVIWSLRERRRQWRTCFGPLFWIAKSHGFRGFSDANSLKRQQTISSMASQKPHKSGRVCCGHDAPVAAFAFEK